MGFSLWISSSRRNHHIFGIVFSPDWSQCVWCRLGHTCLAVWGWQWLLWRRGRRWWGCSDLLQGGRSGSSRSERSPLCQGGPAGSSWELGEKTRHWWKHRGECTKSHWYFWVLPSSVAFNPQYWMGAEELNLLHLLRAYFCGFQSCLVNVCCKHKRAAFSQADAKKAS